jgi:hypothetical protein
MRRTSILLWYKLKKHSNAGDTENKTNTMAEGNKFTEAIKKERLQTRDKIWVGQGWK